MEYSIGPSHRIISIIYRDRIKEQMERLEELRDPHIIYVTDLISCSHKYLLRRSFPELTIHFEPITVFGELIHRGLEAYLSDKGYVVEKPIEKTYTIDDEKYILKGRVDAYNEEEGIVVEIKSGRGNHNLPREHHILQLQIYLNMLDLDKGILIYITPDRLLEFSIDRTAIDIETMLRELVYNSVHPRWQWECKYCIFQRICPYRSPEQLS